MNHHVKIKRLSVLTKNEVKILKYMNMGTAGSMQRRFLSLLEEDRGWALIHYDDEGYIIGWALMFHDRGLNHQNNPEQICIYIYVLPGWRRKGIGTALLEAGRLIERQPFCIPWDATSAAFYSNQKDYKIDFWNKWIPYTNTAATRV